MLAERMVDGKEIQGRRKEPRFKTCDGQVLGCICAVKNDDPHSGTVIDLSTSGLRMLCEGSFAVGQEFAATLKTDRSHGVFRGVIRRVEPWVNGQSVLGCQLLDAIPEDVLQELAERGIINRRRDQRLEWKQPAKMAWELQRDEIDIDIEDCSVGGLKITSPKAIPDNIRLRIRIHMDDEGEAILSARSVWQSQQDDCFQAGLAFTTREVPPIVTRMLAGGTAEEPAWSAARQPAMRRSVLVAAVIVVLGLALRQIGVWG